MSAWATGELSWLLRRMRERAGWLVQLQSGPGLVLWCRGGSVAGTVGWGVLALSPEHLINKFGIKVWLGCTWDTVGTIIAVDYLLHPSPGMEQNLSPETQPLLHL